MNKFSDMSQKELHKMNRYKMRKLENIRQIELDKNVKIPDLTQEKHSDYLIVKNSWDEDWDTSHTVHRGYTLLVRNSHNIGGIATEA